MFNNLSKHVLLSKVLLCLEEHCTSQLLYTQLHTRHNFHLGKSNPYLKHRNEGQQEIVVVWSSSYTLVLNSSLKTASCESL